MYEKTNNNLLSDIRILFDFKCYNWRLNNDWKWMNERNNDNDWLFKFELR